MSRISDLLDNELMRTVITARVDTAWRMLELFAEGRVPSTGEEGATGQFDNKGALFVPGGLVFDDSDRMPIPRERTGPMTAKQFRERIVAAMRHDNATLLYPDDVVHGVNLNNGFFADTAANILASKHAAHKRRPPFEPTPMARIDSQQITRSHIPTYIPSPYGSRTRLSACLAVCLQETRMYYVACRKEFGLRSEQEEQAVWNNIRAARLPVLGQKKSVLAPPCVVVCHTTRYRDRQMGGVNRLLGYGKFGEFASLSLERVTSATLSELNLQTKTLPERYLVAQYGGINVAAVLRLYGTSKLGRRQKRTEAYLVSLSDDLDLDLEAIGRESRERYGLKPESPRQSSSP